MEYCDDDDNQRIPSNSGVTFGTKPSRMFPVFSLETDNQFNLPYISCENLDLMCTILGLPPAKATLANPFHR